jgi:hypothetical protein
VIDRCPHEGLKGAVLVLRVNHKDYLIKLVEVSPFATAEAIASVANKIFEGASNGRTLLIGKTREMLHFLPPEPLVERRYHPLVGVPGIEWGIIIRDHERSLIQSSFKTPTGVLFIKDLVVLILNFGNEKEEKGYLGVAKRAYERPRTKQRKRKRKKRQIGNLK